MKTKVKRTGAMLAAAAYGLTMFAGLGIAFGTRAAAHAETSEGRNYFYSQLHNNSRAQKYYQAFETLDGNGSFKKDEVDFNLVETGTTNSEDVRLYVEEGSPTLPIAFGAGRDAFLMDNPDIFYADVMGVSVSAGTQGGNYVAYLDTSRTDTLYIGGLDTEDKINEAIDRYETKLSEVVSGAKAAGDTLAQIKYVNQYIIDHTEYSFGTIIEDGRNVETEAAAYINTSYGALVYGKAVCGGYAKAYKAVLDRLDIPCVCIQGYKRDDTKAASPYDAHMWNAVKLEGQWYAVDVTWNDTANKPEGWMLLGSQAISKDHVEDNVISSSGFELRYPALKPYNYGVDMDENGMNIKGEYVDYGDGTGKHCTLTVSYEGKGAGKLEEDGKYLAIRMGSKNSETGEIDWYLPWSNFIAVRETFAGFGYTDTESVVVLHAGMDFVQFALIDYAPDYGYLGEGDTNLVTYKDLTDDHIGLPSVPYQNEGAGTYIPAPGAASVTPHNGGTLKVNGTYEVKIVYDEKLVLAEGKKAEDVKLGITTSRGNDTINESCEVIDFKWDGDRTVTFTFKPSKMFIHNDTRYELVPTNLVGEKSNKIPNPVNFYFKGKNVVCSKVFNDGRLYMSVYGAPELLDTSDLSTKDFKDENGNYYAQSQRSQLLLVADKPSKAKEESLKNTLTEETELEKEDIITTATYEIDLLICGSVQKVPNGSYMQVAFGFPEGFSKDDEGTTFKIYHYKHNAQGDITGVEEIPVIVTQYGLIARVKSFSPFAVVQVKKSAVEESAAKNIYASVSGIGGTITNAEGKSGLIEVTGDSVTFEVKAQDGFVVDRLMLNGKTLDKSRYAGGTITLTKEELASGNTLEASFVTAKSVDNYQLKGVDIKKPELIVVDSAKIQEEFTGPEVGVSGNASNSTAIIVGCCVVAVVVIAAGAAVTVCLVKRKKTK